MSEQWGDENGFKRVFRVKSRYLTEWKVTAEITLWERRSQFIALGLEYCDIGAAQEWMSYGTKI